MGGGAGTSCPSISLETNRIKHTTDGRAEPPGRVRVRLLFPGPGSVGPCSPLMGDNGAMMKTSGLDSMSGRQC